MFKSTSNSSNIFHLSNLLNYWPSYLAFILITPILLTYSYVNNADLVWMQLSYMDNLPFTEPEKLATAISFSQKGTFFLILHCHCPRGTNLLSQQP